MSYATSSAQPAQLYRYAVVAGRIDHELASEAGSLGACLRHFEATCREPGYTVNVSSLADALRAYARAAEPVDRWVQEVGRGFERADQRSIFFILRQWVRGLVTTIFGGRSEVSNMSDRYAGLIVQARGTSQLSFQAETIVRSLRPSLPITRPPVFSLWLAFQQTNWALTRVIWSIRYLIFRFHWFLFWRPLPWLGTTVVTTEPISQTQSSTPLGELLTPLPDPAGTIIGGIRPAERSDVANWTAEDAKAFVLQDQGRLPGTEACVAWAKERAKKISGMILPGISTYNSENWGAYNYIDIYADSVIRFSPENAQTTLAQIGSGAVLVYDQGQAGVNKDYGHVAVIEKVEAGGVWVSDSSYAGPNPRFVSTDDLIKYGLYAIPAGAKPSSKDRYEESKRRRRQRD